MSKKLTIVLPVRHELYLQETLDDIFAKAKGDIEVIVVLDNYWPVPPLKDHDNLTIVHWGGRHGMRDGINVAAEIGKGDYLLKVDGHVLFDEGFDEKLKADCDGDWVVVPRRFSLDADTWSIRQEKPAIDYEYLKWPFIDKENLGLHAVVWSDRTRKLSHIPVDENMSFQGSCWFMHMDYFKRLIYPMDSTGYGTFIGEAQEIGLKVWLSGGKNMTNKKTWYAHLWKGKGYREKFLAKMGFPYTRIGHTELVNGNRFSIEYWLNNRWEKRVHDLEWLIEKFNPPTWPKDRSKWMQPSI